MECGLQRETYSTVQVSAKGAICTISKLYSLLIPLLSVDVFVIGRRNASRKAFAAVHGISSYMLDFISDQLKRTAAAGLSPTSLVDSLVKPMKFDDSTRPSWVLAEAEAKFDHLLPDADGKGGFTHYVMITTTSSRLTALMYLSLHLRSADEWSRLAFLPKTPAKEFLHVWMSDYFDNYHDKHPKERLVSNL